MDSRSLSVTLRAPATAVVGHGVQVVVDASGGGVMGTTVMASVVVSDGKVTASDRLSGNYTASVGFTFEPDVAGAITLTATVTDSAVSPLCTIAPITVDTVVQVAASANSSGSSSSSSDAEADNVGPRVSAVRPVQGQAGRVAVFRYRVSKERSTTQEALGIYRKGSSKAVAMVLTKWGKNRGAIGVRWKLPNSLKPGIYTWCVVSKDQSGNVGDGNCSKLTVLS